MELKTDNKTDCKPDHKSDYKPSEVIMIKNEELEMLLAAAGISKWYGIQSGKETAGLEDDGKVNGVLARLYQKGLVDWNEGKARISDSIRPAIQVMKNADSCTVVRRQGEHDEAICCYFDSDKAVIIGRERNACGELGISVVPSDQWPEMLEADGYLPRVADTPDLTEQPDLSTAAAAEDELFTAIEKYAIADGRMLCAMLLYESGLYGKYEIRRNVIGTETVRNSYSQGEIMDMLRRWAGEEL